MRAIITTMLMLAAVTAFAGDKLKVSSKSFKHNGDMPMKYSCEGDNTSPDLHIDNIPKGTKTLAMIMHDPDAPMPGGFTHWVVWNMDVAGDIPENFKGGKQGHNGAKKAGYIGMCPPSGKHHYHFTIYALDTMLDLPEDTNKPELEEAIKGHILAEGTLTGLYQKMK